MILDHEDNNDRLGNLLAMSPLQRLNLEMEQVPVPSRNSLIPVASDPFG